MKDRHANCLLIGQLNVSLGTNMGITVISSPATANKTSVGLTVSDSTTPLAENGMEFDFAALLSSQLSGQEQFLARASTATEDQQGLREHSARNDQDSNIIAEMLSAQESQPIIPYIAPLVERRQPNEIGGKLRLDSDANLDLHSIAKNSPGEAPLLHDPQTAPKSDTKTSQLITPSKLALELNSSSSHGAKSNAQPALFTTSTQGKSEAAILAGEINAGKDIPSGLAPLMAGQSTQPPLNKIENNNQIISTPIQDKRWAQDFGDRITFFAKADIQVAQINITPAQLGPIQITLNLNGDQASLAFASPHAEVRKAIEDAMPNLREMLSTAGISLGQSNVGAQLPQQQRDSSPQFANGNRSAGENAILPADSRSGAPSSGLPIHRGRGLVDLFA